MSNISRDKIELVKNLLKEIHRGVNPQELREKFREVLFKVSPLEIPLIEQELVREGMDIRDIMNLCDLHVELFREMLLSRELSNVPKDHPVDLLVRENVWILKQADILNLYTQALMNTSDLKTFEQYLKTILYILNELKKIRLHYMKIQMLIFPYLEKMGIIAVPRVMWSREDQIIVKIRSLLTEIQNSLSRIDLNNTRNIASSVSELSREISDLVFRENKILFPATYALLPESAWIVFLNESRKIGYVIDIDFNKLDWRPSSKPIYPYEWEPSIEPDNIEKIPEEFRALMSMSQQFDKYVVKSSEDIEFETGFLTPEEIEGIFKSLPLELTYANVDNRIKFFSESVFFKGFVRTKTIFGRRIPHCHAPRLENFVMQNVNEVKQSHVNYREFWTRKGDRILRIIVAPVKNRDGRVIGVLEIVEDLTDIVEKTDEVKKKIMVL